MRFSARECVSMLINCVASGLTYFALLMLDMSDLNTACPTLEELTLIVVVLRIYTLPVICIFKMGIEWCGDHGDNVDLVSLLIFLGVEAHCCIGQAMRRKRCLNFLLDHGEGMVLPMVTAAAAMDLLRVAMHLPRLCCKAPKPVRMDPLPDPGATENCKLLLAEDALLEELNPSPRRIITA